VLTSHPEILDLLEQYMELNGWQEHWITVQEFRRYFNLRNSSSREISGFLGRIYHTPFYRCSYEVVKIEKVRDVFQPCRTVHRYFVQKRMERKKCDIPFGRESGHRTR